jgi:hypothetical protein
MYVHVLRNITCMHACVMCKDVYVCVTLRMYDSMVAPVLQMLVLLRRPDDGTTPRLRMYLMSLLLNTSSGTVSGPNGVVARTGEWITLAGRLTRFPFGRTIPDGALAVQTQEHLGPPNPEICLD